VFLKRCYPTLAMLLWISFPLLASGHGYQAGAIRIVHPWAMPTAASVTDGANGMGYLVLRNASNQPDKLLSAYMEIARKVELHAHGEGGDISTMRRVNSIAIPAGGEVRLEPGGPHFMLMGLKQPLEEGQHFPIVLQFERAGKITVDMFVQKNAKSSIY
jgi:copper(I)-binding protein